MKYLDKKPVFAPVGSLPVRGAWIEIPIFAPRGAFRRRRSPCGERGLKYDVREQNSSGSYVAPRAGSVD